jgi:hypothetical protein
MIRIVLGMILAAGVGGAALAQSTASGSAAVQANPNSSVVQPGIAKPPAGHPAPAPQKQRPGTSPALPNNPTLPQLALHPTATIGSPVPIAGPGGTTKSPTGQ